MKDISLAKPFGFLKDTYSPTKPRGPRSWVRPVSAHSYTSSAFNRSSGPITPQYSPAFAPKVWSANPVADLVSATISATYYPVALAPDSGNIGVSKASLRNRHVIITSTEQLLSVFSQWANFGELKQNEWLFNDANKEFLADTLEKLEASNLDEKSKSALRNILLSVLNHRLPFHILPNLIWITLAYLFGEQQGFKVTLHSNAAHLLNIAHLEVAPDFFGHHLEAIKFDRSQTHTNFYITYEIPNNMNSTDVERSMFALSGLVPAFKWYIEKEDKDVISIPSLPLFARALEIISEVGTNTLNFTAKEDEINQKIYLSLSGHDSSTGNSPFTDALFSLIQLSHLKPE